MSGPRRRKFVSPTISRVAWHGGRGTPHLRRWAFFSILPVASWHLEEAKQPNALAQRIPIDPEQAGRLELIAAREIEGLSQKGSLDPRHDAPVQLAALRDRRLA